MHAMHTNRTPLYSTKHVSAPRVQSGNENTTRLLSARREPYLLYLHPPILTPWREDLGATYMLINRDSTRCLDKPKQPFIVCGDLRPLADAGIRLSGTALPYGEAGSDLAQVICIQHAYGAGLERKLLTMTGDNVAYNGTMVLQPTCICPL